MLQLYFVAWLHLCRKISFHGVAEDDLWRIVNCKNNDSMNCTMSQPTLYLCSSSNVDGPSSRWAVVWWNAWIGTDRLKLGGWGLAGWIGVRRLYVRWNSTLHHHLLCLRQLDTWSLEQTQCFNFSNYCSLPNQILDEDVIITAIDFSPGCILYFSPLLCTCILSC